MGDPNSSSAAPASPGRGLNRAGFPVDRRPGRAYVGPLKPRILFIGEAWGREESLLLQPLVGASGRELFQMLGEALGSENWQEEWLRVRSFFRYDQAWIGHRGAWLHHHGIGFTNVFNLRPPDNNLDHLCGKKDDPLFGYLPPRYPTLGRGRWLLPDYYSELERLEAELLELDPDLVVPLGGTALWALTGHSNIATVRGTVRLGELGAWSGKLLPTYHPAAVLRQWEWRPIAVADLSKAWRESASRTIQRPSRRILVSPTMREIKDYRMALAERLPRKISCDIETANQQITIIGFAPSSGDAMIIPFIDRSKPGWNYWSDPADEIEAWNEVEALLQLDCDVEFQNGMYDLQYILRNGIRPTRLRKDTMLQHHAKFPELQKGLGFLGSVYTSEPAWKLMRRKRPDTEKRDE